MNSEPCARLMTRMMPKGPNLDSIFSKLREMLMREVDYRAERRFTETFAKHLNGDERYAVPKVIGDYCSDMVLTTSFEEGVSVREDSVHDLSQERRNQRPGFSGQFQQAILVKGTERRRRKV